MKPDAAVRYAHAEFDRLLRLGRSQPNAVCTTCVKGCHACCREPVYVNRAEAKLIVKSIPKTEVPGVIERTRTWIERAEASGLLAEDEPHVSRWLAMDLQCPLLKGGLCLVYEHRPTGCRAHNAVRDPALCSGADTRLRQQYESCKDATLACGGLLVMASQEYDNLGAYLARWLLGRKVTSTAQTAFPLRASLSGPANQQVLHIEQTGPQ